MKKWYMVLGMLLVIGMSIFYYFSKENQGGFIDTETKSEEVEN